MSERQWKVVQRKVARQWGFETGSHSGEPGSDGRGEGPVSLEVKRRKGGTILSKDVVQAQAQGAAEGRPWILVVCDYGRVRPKAVVDHAWLLELAKAAGLLNGPE